MVEKPGPLDLNVIEFVWNCKVKRGYVVILMMTGAHIDTWNPGGIHLGYQMLCSELNLFNKCIWPWKNVTILKTSLTYLEKKRQDKNKWKFKFALNRKMN